MTEVKQYKKKEKTHLQIMHAAKLLFEQNGTSAVTAEDISEKADISRSTFFTHFATIDELLKELANQEIEDLLKTYKNSRKTGVEALKVLMNKLIDDTYSYPYLMVELLTKGILNSTNSDKFNEVISLMTKLLIDGKVKEDNLSHKEKVGLILGGYFGLIMQKFILKEKFDDKDVLKASLDKIFFGGLL